MQGKPVVANGRGAADIQVPLVDAQVDAEVQETLDGTPKEKVGLQEMSKWKAYWNRGMIGKIEIR